MYKWLISMSLLCAVANGQSAYTWVDENGLTHFSDQPGPGATVVDLPNAQGFSVPQPATAAPAEAIAEGDPADAYTGFNILQPGQQETLWNVGGSVDVAVRRPDRLHVEYRGDERQNRVVFDGRTLTLFNLGVNVYAVTEVPPEIDASHTSRLIAR